MRNVFESAVQVKINLIFQRKTLRNHSMMQSLVLMTERNPDGTGQPPPPPLPLSLSRPSPSATAVARPNRHSNWQWTQRRGDNYSQPLGNFSGFQFLLFRIHQAPSAGGRVWHLPPPPLPLLPLGLLGALCWCLLARWPVTLRGEDAPSRKTHSVCSVTESRRERKDSFFFFSSFIRSFV